jgi:hypothetical protein
MGILVDFQQILVFLRAFLVITEQAPIWRWYRQILDRRWGEEHRNMLCPTGMYMI